MSSERASAAADLLGLESLGWVDNLTRALALEVSTFTPGSNTFSTLTLVRRSTPIIKTVNPFHPYLQVMEMPLGGNVVVSSYTYTSRLYRYITTADYMRLGFELSSVLLIILDLFEKLLCQPPPLLYYRKLVLCDYYLPVTN
jgi:hypothetical protein